MPRILDGTTWLLLAVSAENHSVSVDMVRKWVERGHVQSHKIDGRIWVCDDEVADMELANYKRFRADTPAV